MAFLKEIFSEFSKDRCPTLAASIAYSTAFALPALLFLFVTILTFGLRLTSDSQEAEKVARQQVEQQAAQLLGNKSASEEIGHILEQNKNLGGQWWKVLISLIGIVVGATGVMATLQDSLNQVWEVRVDPQKASWMNLFTKRIFSLGMIFGLGFVLLTSLMISAWVTGVGQRLGALMGIEGLVADLLNYGVQAVVLFIVFMGIFKFMPDAKIAWRDACVGAAFTTVLFLLGRFALQIYFQYSNPAEQLGSAAASFAVILIWVYYSSLILLFGAEATQVFASRYGQGIHAEQDAVHVREVTTKSS